MTKSIAASVQSRATAKTGKTGVAAGKGGIATYNLSNERQLEAIADRLRLVKCVGQGCTARDTGSRPRRRMIIPTTVNTQNAQL